MQQDSTNNEEKQAVTDAADRKALESNNTMDAQKIAAAHDQAERDMEEDAELTATSPNDDLDEGETARLGEENTGLI